MGKHRRSTCIKCGASGNDVPISLRGLCDNCAVSNRLTAAEQIRNREGPEYDKWLLALMRPRAPRVPTRGKLEDMQ